MKSKADYERIISEQNLRITQVTNEKDELANYIQTHDKSVDIYQK